MDVLENVVDYTKKDPYSALRMFGLESLLPGGKAKEAMYGGLDALGHAENIGLGAALGGTLGKIFDTKPSTFPGMDRINPDQADEILYPGTNDAVDLDDVLRMAMFPQLYGSREPNRSLDLGALPDMNHVMNMYKNQGGMNVPTENPDIPRFTEVGSGAFKVPQHQKAPDVITRNIFEEVFGSDGRITDEFGSELTPEGLKNIANIRSLPYRLNRKGEFDLLNELPQTQVQGSNYGTNPLGSFPSQDTCLLYTSPSPRDS